MGKLTLILVDDSEIPIEEYKNPEFSIFISLHDGVRARVHINSRRLQDDISLNQGECWPLEREVSNLTKIIQVNHYPPGVER